ncbi:Phenylalanine--tRNA ligase beta subunit [Mannheimia haemolytica]|uniref:Phenylalanine--tRNA ligase beta subunit n=1 Tax=Mannheimia haemolytica TaxID=75985 RepID=A0A378N1E6_MANHA|nr:Phenylalanine--tRNA ligase beta subunit [Mannheimia haemolytica]
MGFAQSIPIVDITNLSLLELGQPMHAFDAAKIEGGIQVRMAKEGEELVLLDGTNAKLQSNTLVIADSKGALLWQVFSVAKPAG